MEVDGEAAVASAGNACAWEDCTAGKKASLVGSAGGLLSGTKWDGSYLCATHMNAAGRELKETNVRATKSTRDTGDLWLFFTLFDSSDIGVVSFGRTNDVTGRNG